MGDWKLGDFASFGAFCIALVLFAERVVSRLISGQYVTRDELRAAERATNDGLLIEGRMRADLQTRIQIIEVNMEHLPTDNDIAELKADVARLSEGQAVGNVMTENMREELRQIRLSIDRLGEDVRKRS